MTITISHELYGDSSEFATLNEAQEAIRSCGDDFADVTLSLRGDGVVVNERGDEVGVAASQTRPAPYIDDDDNVWI